MNTPLLKTVALCLGFMLTITPLLAQSETLNFRFNVSGPVSPAFTRMVLTDVNTGMQVGQIAFPLPMAAQLEVESLPVTLYMQYMGETPDVKAFVYALHITANAVTITGELAKPTQWVVETGYAKQAEFYQLIQKQRNPEALAAHLYEHPDLPNAERYLYAKMEAIDPGQLRAVYERLPAERQQSALGLKIKNHLDLAGEGVVVLDGPYHEVSGVDAAGTPRQLSELVGDKWVLLEFSAVGCGPCSAAVPELAALAEAQQANLEVVSVWEAPDPEAWQQMVHRFYAGEVPFHDWWDTSLEGIHFYQVQAYPTYFLISPAGTVADTWTGYRQGGTLTEKVNSSME